MRYMQPMVPHQLSVNANQVIFGTCQRLCHCLGLYCIVSVVDSGNVSIDYSCNVSIDYCCNVSIDYSCNVSIVESGNVSIVDSCNVSIVRTTTTFVVSSYPPTKVGDI